MSGIGEAVSRAITPPKPKIPTPVTPPVAPVAPTESPVPVAVQEQAAVKQDSSGRKSTILSNDYSDAGEGGSDVLG